MKNTTILIGIFLILLIGFFAYEEKHTWDNLGRYCKEIESKYGLEYCNLKWLQRTYDVGTCICVKDNFGEYTVREEEINLSNRIWYKIYKLG